ncbi:Protein PNS1 [Entamoeba marina]
MEIPIPTDAFDKSAYYQIDRLNDRKGIVSIALISFVVFVLTVFGFVKDPKNVYVNTTQKSWISGELFAYVHSNFVFNAMCIACIVSVVTIFLYRFMPSFLTYVNITLCLLLPSIGLTSIFFYLGMNDGLSHHPIELCISIIYSIFCVTQAIPQYQINWKLTVILFNFTMNIFIQSFIVLLPVMIFIVVHLTSSLLVFYAFISLQLIGFPTHTNILYWLLSFILLLSHYILCSIFKSTLIMLISSTLSNTLHPSKGLDVVYGFVKTFSYRLGSTVFAIENLFIGKIISISELLLKTPLKSIDSIKQPLEHFISEHTQLDCNISPYVFIGYYGHTYLHSRKGLNEKIEESSMKNIIKDIHFTQFFNIIKTSLSLIVVIVMTLYSYGMYGGSVSTIVLLVIVSVHEVIDVMCSVIQSIGEIILFDCTEQLAEGELLPQFSGFVQLVSDNASQNGYEVTK